MKTTRSKLGIKVVILESLIKKGNALNKKFLDSQFVNFLFQSVVHEIILLDVGLNGVVESKLI